MSNDKYVSPLSERYASKEMQYIFSPDMKFKTWRKLWIALAETEKELGLNITQEQIDDIKKTMEDKSAYLLRVEAQYRKQFNAMETAMNMLKSQMNSISASLASLSGSKSE